MFELKLLVLVLVVSSVSCCDWGRWGSCNRQCGGGNRTRTGSCGLFGWGSDKQKESCNEFCYNGGSFYLGHCHCSVWRSGSCCQYCRHIHINHCKQGKQKCGGSPDNIRCTECENYYVSAGYGKGCKRCEHNFLVDQGVPKCTCRKGYRLSSNGYSCYDVDECATRTSHCSQICTNTQGSFRCSCNHGYRLDSDGKTCSDIDECLTGVAKCGQKCINLPGSFKCSCRPGYTLSTNSSCTDINECNMNNGRCKQVCVNEQGSFHCACRNGYRLATDQKSCVDIDECTEGISRCSQICHNKLGAYTCSCQHGYSLTSDGYTCKDIDDCLGVTCENSGSCLDNIGSFTCSCKKGFTGRHCELDVNECEGFLHGGCEDICVNTAGSFRCECSGNTTLNSDGMSCEGKERSASVFVRHGIVRQLLPRGCSTILLTRCTSGNTINVFMSSTSPWYQLRANRSIIYTFGIVFVEVNTLSLPVSIAGIELIKTDDNFAIKSGSLALHVKDGDQVHGNDRKNDCLSFDITPRDIHDFLMSLSFMKSFFKNLEDVLPDWLRFTQSGSDILNVNDLNTELLLGHEIQTGTCRGAPLYENRLYTVLKFGSSFSISMYGEEVVVPTLMRNNHFCLIIDICQDYGGSLFLIIPKESRNILSNLTMFDQIRRKYGIEIQPTGLGLSLLRHINVRESATSLQLWNGDSIFDYQVMPEASLWIGGGAVWKPNEDADVSFELKTKSNIFISIPNLKSILKSIFLDEWNAYFDMDLIGSLDIKFQLFARKQLIHLNVVKSDIKAYASLGGLKQRKWCGVNADPPGLFVSLMVDVNPFQHIPILKDGLFDFNNKVYAFFATDPTPTISKGNNIDIIEDIFDLKGMTEIFMNTTIRNVHRYSSLLINESVVTLSHLENTADAFILTLGTLLKELRQNNEHSFTNLVENVSNIWQNGWKTLKKDVELFKDSIEHNNIIAKYNFTSIIEIEMNHLKEHIETTIDRISSQIMYLYKNPVGFGLRYQGTLKIFFIKIVGLEIEFVYSVDQLGSCSRYNKVYELFKDERAVRIYGVLSTGILKIAPFIRMDVGGGVGLAISIDTPEKVIAQLHAEATVLGIKAECDIYLSPKGHYFFLTGNIWNAFKAELEVSFESSVTGIETLDILGRFIANGGESDSFQDSYLDGLRKITQKIADVANDRISAVQNGMSTAQKALSKAQTWLEGKKNDIRNANEAFDKAIESLESAKDKLEEAKIPFKNALSKVNEAQRKLDSLCKIKTCSQVCVPGIKCRICWHKVWFVKIPLPCCHFTSCMFSFPNPVCVAYNLGCSVIRGVAYVALEAVKVLIRIPMLALDAAKLALSGAQFIVDKSRVVLDIAIGAVDLAQIGLEGAKYILEEAKYALEAVKRVVSWGIKALNFIIEYGLQSIIDVKNCGFELKTTSHDSTVFHVECEINLFRQGFRKVRLGVNFGNTFQSIWQAAKGTIDTFVDVPHHLSERKKREVKYEALSGLYSVIRKVRNADIDADDFDVFVNETIDTTFNTNGFKKNISIGDYENRVEVFHEKCSVMTTAMAFFSEAVQVLFEMSNETASMLNNASSIEESLGTFNVEDIASNFSIDNIGINTDAAMDHFNISVDDINIAMQGAKKNLTNDPLLSGINNLTSDAKTILKNQAEDANNVNIISHWVHAMENASFEYFSKDDCVSFLDCAHFAIFQLYELFDAENVSNMSKSLNAISEFEDTILDLVGNISSTVVEVYSRTTEMQKSLDTIQDSDVFCSKAPTMLSEIGNYNVTEGSTLKINCNASGNPQPEIWWYKDDVYLPDQHDIYLIIVSISKQDESKYHCVAGNLVANLTSGYAEVFVSEDTPELPGSSSPKYTEAQTKDKIVSQNHVNVEKNDNGDQGSTNLVLILGTSLGVLMVVVVIGIGFAWRLHVRKRTRKSDGPGSLTSLNMVRPTDSKPVFKTRVVAFEASTQ